MKVICIACCPPYLHQECGFDPGPNSPEEVKELARRAREGQTSSMDWEA